MDRKDSIVQLSKLIQACLDGREVFTEAATNAKNQQLKILFTKLSNERSKFVSELQPQLLTIGGDPDQEFQTSHQLRSAWSDLKGSLTGKTDRAILRGVEKGEQAALTAYETALNADLPPGLRPVVERQLTSIRDVHSRILRMRDAKSMTA